MKLKWISPSVLEFSASTRSPKKLNIWIDPGHGGDDFGTQENGIVEKDLSLDISKRLKVALTKLGHEVTLSRENDKNLELWQRFNDLQHHSYDLALSLHFDHISKEEIKQGTRPACYYNSLLFKPLAENVCLAMSRVTGEDLGSVKRHLLLLNYPYIPVILLEVLNLQMTEHKKIYMDKNQFEYFGQKWSDSIASEIHRNYEEKP